MGNFFSNTNLSSENLNSLVKPTISKAVIGITLISSYFLISPISKMIASYLETRLMEKKNANRPQKLILIRHGQSLGNIDNKIYSQVPDNQINLSELGHEQAFQAGLSLKEIINKNDKTKFYVSPFLRTKQTFKEISAHFTEDQYTYIEDPRLREQEWGNYQESSQLDKIRVERRKVGKFYYRFPTGESGADVYDRASLFLTSLFREIDGESIMKQRRLNVENVVIVTHGLFIRLFLMRYFKWTVEEFEEVENSGNCEIIVLEKKTLGRYELTTELRRKSKK
jgi:broad specificity phosphatase PhoE